MNERENRQVSLTLSQDEALVFFEWLIRIDEESEKAGAKLDDAELIVRWRLEGQLEGVLPLFRPDYEEIVRSAGKRIVKSAVVSE